MNIYIGGIETLKAGDEISISENVDGILYARLCPNSRVWHKVIVVPPHGRLIDADDLREYWLENGENEHIYDANAFLDLIDDASTIIEAKGGG